MQTAPDLNLWELSQHREPEVLAVGPGRYLTANYWLWLAVGALLVVQWCLFRQYALREVIWAYPTFHDQATYLNQAYEAFEGILTRGLLPGLWEIVRTPIANGIMLQVQASLFFLIAGPSRMSALTLNFLYFAMLQCALVAILRALTRRWSVALVGEGLLLTVITPFFWAGGIMDFRIDFIAFCLFGILFALIMWSGVFVSRHHMYLVGMAAAVLILFRFIMLVYIAGMLGLCLLYFCAKLWTQRRKQAARQLAANQIINILLSGVIIGAFVLPVLWHNRYELYNYYVVGHVTGAEPAIRARQVGAVELLDVVLFYPRSVIEDHAGTTFLVVSGILLAIGAGFYYGRRAKQSVQAGGAELDVAAAYVLIAASLIVPYTVLTIDVAKSQIVGNILIHPLLWFVVLSFHLFSKPVDVSWRLYRYILAGIATLVLLIGIYTQFDRFSRHGSLTISHLEVEQIDQLHEAVFHYSQQTGLEHPLISADRIVDYFNANVLRVVSYERYRTLFNTDWGLGLSLFADDESKIFDTVNKSDLLVVTRSIAPEPLVYPFDIQMERLRPRLIALCNEVFVPIKHFSIYNRDAILCARPQVTTQGDSAGWLTDAGLILRGTTQVLRARPTIELSGQTNFAYLSKVPSITADLLLENKAAKPIAVTLERSASNEQAYVIRLRLDPADLSEDGPAQIRLAFDSYFVPKDIGLNGDTRRLVIRTPSQITLAR